MSDDTTWLKFIISEIAEVAPWEDRSPAHAAAHVRNLILNLRAEANVERAELKAVKAELARMKARPVEVEYTRLDAMWQQLVRERDEAVHALSELRPLKQELPKFDANDLQIDVLYGRGRMGPSPRRPHAVRVTHIPTGKQATGYHECFVSAAKDHAMQQLSAMLGLPRTKDVGMVKVGEHTFACTYDYSESGVYTTCRVSISRELADKLGIKPKQFSATGYNKEEATKFISDYLEAELRGDYDE